MMATNFVKGLNYQNAYGVYAQEEPDSKTIHPPKYDADNNKTA